MAVMKRFACLVSSPRLFLRFSVRGDEGAVAEAGQDQGEEGDLGRQAGGWNREVCMLNIARSQNAAMNTSTRLSRCQDVLSKRLF